MPLKQWPVDIQHGVMIEVNLEQVNGIGRCWQKHGKAQMCVAPAQS